MSRASENPATQQPDSVLRPEPRSLLLPGLIANLVISAALGFGMGFVQANAERFEATLPSLFPLMLGAGIAGLASGIVTRLLLRGWTGILRFSVAATAMILWLATAETSYALLASYAPIEHLATLSGWPQLGQLGIGWLCVLFSDLATGLATKGRLTTPEDEAITRKAWTDLKWGIALALILAVALGIDAGYMQIHASLFAVPSPALDLLAAGIVGLAAGVVVRLALPGWTKLLKLLLSALTVAAWVIIAETTYAVLAGLPLLDYVAGADNWIEMGQLGIGYLSASAAILAGSAVREKVRLAWVWRAKEQVAIATVIKSRLRWGILFGLGLAVTLGLGIGFIRSNLELIAAPFPHLALALSGAALMGLATGAVLSFTMRGWGELLRLTIILLALPIWILLADVAYTAWIGREPLEYLAAADTWSWASQFIVGCLGAVVGGWARRRVRPVTVGTILRYNGSGAAPTQVITPDQLRREQVQPRRRLTAPRRRFQLPSLPRLSMPDLRRLRMPDLSQLGLPGLDRLRQSPAESTLVTVIAREEDRCPYCLDLIQRRDARGTVRCRICGTPHHRDCWEEGGGSCQVPHLNA
jgi:hypothetical protein